MDFDEVLAQHVGGFGFAQLLFYIGVASIGVQVVIGVLEYSFIGATPQHWCDPAGLNTYNFTQQEIEQFVSPVSQTGCDPCFMYIRNYGNVSEHAITEFLSGNYSNEEDLATTECTAWTYDESQYHNTVVTEWDLVCGRKWLMATSQSIFMAGQFAVVFSGYLSDKHGRRVAMLVALLGHTVARTVTTFSANFYMFVGGRLLLSMCDIGWYTSVYVFGVEFVGPRWRVLSGAVPYYFWLAGYVIQALMAYLIRDWRMLMLTGTILGLPYLLHLYFLPESPRWLVANGQIEKAKKILKKMAKLNKKPQLPNDLLIHSKKTNKEKSNAKIRDLFKSWYFIKITLVFFFQWNAITLVYYGLTFYLPSLGGNPYISLVFSGLVEIPAVLYAQFAMDTRLGRKWNLILWFLFSGVLLLLILVIPKDNNWLVIAAAVLGKWGVSANWSFLYMITSEVYPTPLRNIGLSVCSMVGRFGGIFSPFISQLAIVHPYLPAVVMGVLAVAAGLLGLLLPETRGKHLPDTVQEATTGSKSDRKELPSEEISLKDSNSPEYRDNENV